MITIGSEVLKVLCGLIKVCCMLGWGRVETTVQALETLPVRSRWLCSPQHQATSAVMTGAVHQKSPTQAPFGAGFSSKEESED